MCVPPLLALATVAKARPHSKLARPEAFRTPTHSRHWHSTIRVFAVHRNKGASIAPRLNNALSMTSHRRTAILRRIRASLFGILSAMLYESRREAAGIEPASRHYRNLLMARDFRILVLVVNDLRSRVECSAVLPSHEDILETAPNHGQPAAPHCSSEPPLEPHGFNPAMLRPGVVSSYCHTSVSSMRLTFLRFSNALPAAITCAPFMSSRER